LNPLTVCTEFSAKAWQDIFLCYVFDSHAWLVFNPAIRNAIRSRNVSFTDTWFPFPPMSTTPGEFPPTPNTSSIDPREPPLQFLTGYDDFEDNKPVVSHTPSAPLMPLAFKVPKMLSSFIKTLTPALAVIAPVPSQTISSTLPLPPDDVSSLTTYALSFAEPNS
jgi:hypothetical protein